MPKFRSPTGNRNIRNDAELLIRCADCPCEPSGPTVEYMKSCLAGGVVTWTIPQFVTLTVSGTGEYDLNCPKCVEAGNRAYDLELQSITEISNGNGTFYTQVLWTMSHTSLSMDCDLNPNLPEFDAFFWGEASAQICQGNPPRLRFFGSVVSQGRTQFDTLTAGYSVTTLMPSSPGNYNLMDFVLPLVPSGGNQCDDPNNATLT